MCFSSPSPPPPPPPPAPPPAPPIAAPVAPQINQADKNATDASDFAAGQRRGTNSLKIDLANSGGTGLAIPS
jgi:hypothetical protein